MTVVCARTRSGSTAYTKKKKEKDDNKKDNEYNKKDNETKKEQ